MKNSIKNRSGPVELISLIMREAWSASGKSWTRLNGGLREALAIAITVGMKFARDDFKTLDDKHSGGFWFGANHEWFFRLAVENRNSTAAISFERWKGRKRFMWKGRRLHVGASFRWERDILTVTSFSDDGTYLIACAYHYPDRRPAGASNAKNLLIDEADAPLEHFSRSGTIAKRVKIPREILQQADKVDRR